MAVVKDVTRLARRLGNTVIMTSKSICAGTVKHGT
jgi:hypothetical protein